MGDSLSCPPQRPHRPAGPAWAPETENRPRNRVSESERRGGRAPATPFRAERARPGRLRHLRRGRCRCRRGPWFRPRSGRPGGGTVPATGQVRRRGLGGAERRELPPGKGEPAQHRDAQRGPRSARRGSVRSDPAAYLSAGTPTAVKNSQGDGGKGEGDRHNDDDELQAQNGADCRGAGFFFKTRMTRKGGACVRPECAGAGQRGGWGGTAESEALSLRLPLRIPSHSAIKVMVSSAHRKT